MLRLRRQSKSACSVISMFSMFTITTGDRMVTEWRAYRELR
ncbi:MAG: hypothetical protein ACLULH_07915 [Bacteroides fragilis]